MLRTVNAVIGVTTICARVESAIKSHFMSSASLHGIGYGTHPRMDYKNWWKAVQSNAMNLGDYKDERYREKEPKTKNSLLNELVSPERWAPDAESLKDKAVKEGWELYRGTDATHTALITETVARSSEMYDKDGEKLGFLWDLTKVENGKIVIDPRIDQIMTPDGLKKWDINFTRNDVNDIINATVHITDRQYRAGLNSFNALSTCLKNIGFSLMADQFKGRTYDYASGTFSEGGHALIFSKKGWAYGIERLLVPLRVFGAADRIFTGGRTFNKWEQSLANRAGKELTLQERQDIRKTTRMLLMGYGISLAARYLLLLSDDMQDEGGFGNFIEDVKQYPGMLTPIAPTKDARDRVMLAATRGDDSLKSWPAVLLSKFLMDAGNSVMPLAELYQVMSGLPLVTPSGRAKGMKILKWFGDVFHGVTTGEWERYDDNKKRITDIKAIDDFMSLLPGYSDIDKLSHPSNDIRYQLKPFWEE